MKRDSFNYDIVEIRDYYPSLNNPSSSTWVFNQVVSLQNMGYRPLVISPTPMNPLKKVFKNKFRLYDNASKKLEIYKDTHVIRPGYLKIPNKKFVGFTIKNLSKCIRNNGNISGIKFIHAHFGQNGVAALSLKEKLRVPLITSFYGYDSGRLSEIYRPYYHKLIKNGDLFLVLSQDMKKDLLKLGFPEAKIVIHHLGVDLNTFKKDEKKSKKFILLTVARLDIVKGIQFIIQAFSEFIIKYPHLKNQLEYRIIGGGDYERQLKNMVKALNLSDSIIFVNNLIKPNSREIVRTEMQNCDLFCLCSYVLEDGAKEGTPVVLMEAQACGKPCIASVHAGIPEVVKQNETGILVEEKSVSGILAAIEILYFNKSLRNELARNAFNHIALEYNHQVQMEKLVLLFNSLIN